MNPQLRKALIVASLGAAGGIGVLFACFVLGIGRPTPNGDRGIIGSGLVWFLTPCAWLGDWAIKRQLISSDNMLVGLAVMFAYSALTGAIVALACHYLWRWLRIRQANRL